MTLPVRTSLTHPLYIDELAAPAGGTVGMTLCPGKQGRSSLGEYRWQRDLALDTTRVAAWRPDWWLCVMEPDELTAWKAQGLPFAAHAVGAFALLPVTDLHAPGTRFAARWAKIGPAVHDCLRRGGRVLIQCRGGRGRAGTVAAQLLIEQGLPAQRAIAMVRAARPGAIEMPVQRDYLHGLPGVAAGRGAGAQR